MERKVIPGSLKAWLLAARPKTLSGAAVPVMIGLALAFADIGVDRFDVVPAVLCVLFAFIMQIDANFVNDYFDFVRGNDDDARLGPCRACAQGWVTPRQMVRAILITTITAKQYEQALKKYPTLSGLYALVKDFYGAIFSKKPEKIDSWIESAKKYDIPELQTFVEGLLKDLQAIKNGITYPYNNGLAEGSVNKIKVIKRIMYGRSSFDLLKAKVLFHELFHIEIN